MTITGELFVMAVTVGLTRKELAHCVSTPEGETLQVNLYGEGDDAPTLNALIGQTVEISGVRRGANSPVLLADKVVSVEHL